ncbi:MAG: translation elongation factor Ts [Elusimicrobiota bacterium]|jgi:elongation factor Ts|nr:translation elongation factor Ts [Elusimicrobiota bacterium]
MSTLELIKTLREKTGAGLADCKNALGESNNDLEAAIICLRKKGLADMAKRAGRETKEGRTVIKTDGKYYAMASLGCETDFVAKTPDFEALVSDIAGYMLKNPAVADYTQDAPLKKIIEERAPKFGENISFTQAVCWPAPQGCGVINYYLHTDNKKAAMVEFKVTPADGGECKCSPQTKETLTELAKNIAMQGVGMVAQYLKKEDVPQSVIDNEKDIAATQAKNEGKPEAAIEKMLPGRIQKFFKDVVLLEQPAIKDSKLSVRDLINAVGKDLGVNIEVVKYVRF